MIFDVKIRYYWKSTYKHSLSIQFKVHIAQNNLEIKIRKKMEIVEISHHNFESDYDIMSHISICKKEEESKDQTRPFKFFVSIVTEKVQRLKGW